MRQIAFPILKNYKKEFGGTLNLRKRKSRRPLSTKSPIHLVLKSSKMRIFNPQRKIIHKLIRSQSKKFNIQIYDYAANWSHIHMLIKIPSRESYLKWIRSLTSLLVQKLSEESDQNLKGVFDLVPYTKIISWGRQFKRGLRYQRLNQAESLRGNQFLNIECRTLHKPNLPNWMGNLSENP